MLIMCRTVMYENFSLVYNNAENPYRSPSLENCISCSRKLIASPKIDIVVEDDLLS
jgi:hypothetical protein